MSFTLPRYLALSFVLGATMLAQTPETPSTPPAPPAPQTPRTVHPQITAPEENAPPPNPQAAGSPRVVEIPLLDCSGLPCIDMATASGKTLRLAIDTAEANPYLDTKAAQALGLALQPLKGNGDSSVSEIQKTVVPGAKLGDLAMGDFPFLVLELNQSDSPSKKSEPFPADGALTYRAFQNRRLEIDYAHHLVRISEPQDVAPSCPGSCSDLIIKHIGAHGPATLTAGGFAINGQPVDAQIDTLFTGTMLVYPESVEKLDLKKQSKSKQKDFFPYVESGIKLARFDGAAEGFRDVSLANDAPLYFFTSDNRPPAVQFDVTVGSGLLSHGTVIFDFKGMHMWMENAATVPSSSPRF